MKHQLQTIREALEIGRDAAQQVAEHYHAAMAGYAPDRHKAMDDDVAGVEKALTALSELERMAVEPFALLVRKNSWNEGQWECAPPNSPNYGLVWANERMFVYAAPVDQQQYEAGDMASAHNDGFRAGVASVAQQPQAEAKPTEETFNVLAWLLQEYEQGEGNIPDGLYNAARKLHHAQPAQAEAVPTVTPAMVNAYLKANTAYWQQQDELPKPPTKWINGTPQEATRVSLIAALAAAPKQAEAVPQGWKLVPVEPTEAMLKAAKGNLRMAAGIEKVWRESLVEKYRAMIAAAQGEKP